ncbi:mitochondrial import inner membrane translocase subunit Tim9-like [Mytilus galloprovincialis]|uniref:mitochondrial import inner membrane translocase subunit Tim9-like n=1 Tax=Mytilus trossulus TaxID=6551 RepID=UPI00300536AD
MNPQGGLPQMDTEATVKQFKEFLSQYNRLTEMCFIDCAKDFTTRTVLKAENNCALNCLEKYLKMTQRISQRFQEYQLQQSEASTPVRNVSGT